MNKLQERLSHWGQDNLLGKVLRNSAHLFSSNTISLGLSVLQSILAARLLGPAGFGLVAIVMGYASTVNGLFSFRMSELVVKYGGEYLEKKENDKASVLMKSAMLGEGLVSLLAFIFVALTAGLASRYISKTPDTVWMFIAYSVGLLANFNTETSTGILQVTDKIKLQGTINLVQSIVTALIIAVAFFWNGSLAMVLGAYLLGKAILGLGIFTAAQIQLRRVLGRGWSRVVIASRFLAKQSPDDGTSRQGPEQPPGKPRLLRPEEHPPRNDIDFRELFRFAFSSNLSATLILIFRESEILWVGYFLTNEAAGYYKAAYAIASLLSVPANPLILSTYPEINKLIVQKAWPRLRDFLRKITTLAFAYNMAIGLAFLVFGRWLLLIYGEQYSPAYPALLALLVGLIFNYTLFWNRPLLLSLGLPGFPLKATLVAGLAKMALAFPLVPRFGYVAEAALLSFYYISSVSAMVWRGLKEIRVKEER